MSFDRPLAHARSQTAFEWEYPFVRFVEREGYDVSYATDVDVDTDPGELQRHRLVIAAGHSEYWTMSERGAYDGARDAGVNLVFLGANTGYAQVRYEDSKRTLVIYRSFANDPVTDRAQATVTFRELGAARRECYLVGVAYQGGLLGPDETAPDYIATYATATHPWFVDTGIGPGTRLQGVVGYEWDSTVPGCTPERATVLFRLAGGSGGPRSRLDRPAESVVYTTAAGSRVFSTGTLGLIQRLDDFGHPNSQDVRIQQFMRNVLNDLAR